MPRPSSHGWHISFHPHIDLLKTGNDPVRMFRELDALGEFSAEPDISLLPEFLLMEPENSALSWSITLKGNIKIIFFGEKYYLFWSCGRRSLRSLSDGDKFLSRDEFSTREFESAMILSKETSD